MQWTKLAGLLLIVAISGCDATDPRILVRLEWDSSADLELLIDETPAYRQGGSPERAGLESYEIPRGEGSYVVAVRNLSGHEVAHPTITIEGAKDEGASPSLFSRPIEFRSSVYPNSRRDVWVACEIDAAKGTLRRIESWE